MLFPAEVVLLPPLVLLVLFVPVAELIIAVLLISALLIWAEEVEVIQVMSIIFLEKEFPEIRPWLFKQGLVDGFAEGFTEAEGDGLELEEALGLGKVAAAANKFPVDVSVSLKKAAADL